MTMPAGRYYVGDLCYVISDDSVWSEICELTMPYNPETKETDYRDGEFTLKDGRRFANFGTVYGDGTYRSSIGTDHCVDSGSIGCISVYDIQDKTYDLERLQQLGAIVDFEAPFEVSADYGLLKFGSVMIETAPDQEELET